MTIIVRFNEALLLNARERAILDPIAHVLREEIVHLQTLGDPVTTRKSQFPNLRVLSFAAVPLRTMFPDPDLGRDREIFLSLQHVSLRELVGHGNWNPLINFLACCASSGNRLDMLEISGSLACGSTKSQVECFTREKGSMAKKTNSKRCVMSRQTSPALRTKHSMAPRQKERVTNGVPT